MSDADIGPTAPDPADETTADETTANEAAFTAAYDLDGDGEVSLIESERGRLGMIDARLEEIAEEGGLKGKLAELAHEVVDKLDND
ncbi:MAG TPA: hypothetical protein VNQ73_07500 [Ilumatobacter sp.]|nr:hypothetical protein [Ilumatobacter sp.]